jgi:hypothetical protein
MLTACHGVLCLKTTFQAALGIDAAPTLMLCLDSIILRGTGYRQFLEHEALGITKFLA